jgi:transcription elongation factor Elf1
MILGQLSLIRNSKVSDIKVFDLKGNHISEYDIDIITECLDDHRKCIGEYTNHQLKISFACHCKCHKKKITIDEILEKLNSNICLECGNDHSYSEYQNNKKKTSFDIFQEIIDNYSKNRMVKDRRIMEVVA